MGYVLGGVFVAFAIAVHLTAGGREEAFDKLGAAVGEVKSSVVFGLSRGLCDERQAKSARNGV